MKTKKYRNGKVACKTYMKPAGNGFEVGLTFGNTPVFCGNFVKRSEASTWYATMNKEIGNFAKRYKVGNTYPQSWYRHFLSNHLYNRYYDYLNRVFAKHRKTFKTNLNKDLRKYKTLSRRWTPNNKMPGLKAA